MDWIAIIIGSVALVANLILLPFNIKKYREQSRQIKEAKRRARS